MNQQDNRRSQDGGKEPRTRLLVFTINHIEPFPIDTGDGKDRCMKPGGWSI